ncbi:peptidogalycan biosysnthesis protein [Boseaceae bacterium BT-24-1]|nr:peptidogalycan biosysnthesis protein [Boseaceae bacterium BT-24-1]
MEFFVRTTPVTLVPRPEWDGCFPQIAESHAYYCACEAAQPEHVQHQAMTVADGENRIVALAPMFRMDYELHTPFQDGWLRTPLGILSGVLPGLLRLPVIGLGSPFAEQAHLGFSPDICPQRKHEAAARLLDGLEREAEQHEIGLMAVKDICGGDLPAFLPHFHERGYVRLASLPTAVLHLPFRSTDEYLASLSSATRKDVRRKLRTVDAVEIEMRTDIAEVADEIYALYEETRGNSATDYGDFEKLPRNYFTTVISALFPRAVCVLYRVSGVLAAFNLLFIENDRVIDKFWGMRYPLAQEANLYFISWIHNVRFCIESGKSRLQTGQGTFANKLRLGSTLEPLHIYFRHRRKIVHHAFRVAASVIDFERLDPDLAAHQRRVAAKKADLTAESFNAGKSG